MPESIVRFPCSQVLLCPGTDDPIANLSSEGYDQRRYFRIVYPTLGWRGQCCGYVCESFVSQELADICAQNMVRYADAGYCGLQLMPDGTVACIEPFPPPPDGLMFWNAELCLTIACPDGSIFTYCVSAHTFAATTQEEADRLAELLATERVNTRKFCCGTNTVCCCVGSAIDFTLTVDGGIGPFNWIPVGGSWPAGLAATIEGADGRSLHITGTAAAAGNTVIGFLIYDADGNYLTKSFDLHAIEISTTALPDFTLGVPYSHQLTAAGGSGSYAWAIVTGSLPAGLTMSVSGLISGTPTAATTESILFEVIDLVCEATNRQFYPPRIALTGQSVSTIATIKGFLPYIQTFTPPKKYKKLTWSGTSEQWAVTFVGSLPCSGAKYVWSGASEINAAGSYISQYRKDYYAQCPADITPPTINTTPDFGLTHLEGYCWPADPGSCPTCPASPYNFVADRAANNIYDGTTFLNDVGAPGHTVTALTLSNVSGSTVTGFIAGAVGFPVPPQIILHSSHNYSAVLSDEYTDADALASALVLPGNGKIAANLPRTTGFTSQWTTVQFRLACSNLLVGQGYTVRVEFQADNGSHTTQTYNFTATAATHLITDNIPTPPTGGTLEVRNPTIAFA